MKVNDLKETHAIVPLREYNRLKKIEKEFVKEFDKNKIYIHSRSYFTGPSGYPSYDHYIINPTELVNFLNGELDKLNERNTQLYNENYELKYRESNKSWWKKLLT